MKKTVFIFVLIFAFFGAEAQKIGLKGGINLMTFANNYSIDSKMLTGYNASFFFQKRIFPMFTLRPELSFSQKGYKYEEITSTYSYKGSMYTNNIGMYFNLRIKPPVPVYVVAGPYFSYALSGYYQEELELGGLVSKDAGDIDFEKSDLAKSDLGLVGGLGYLLNLPVVDFFIEARYEYGLRDLNLQNDYYLKNRNFTLSAGMMIGF